MCERLDDLSKSVSTDELGESDNIKTEYGFDTEEIFAPSQLLTYIRYARKPIAEMLQGAGVVANVMCFETHPV
jgi:hypothetical protein